MEDTNENKFKNIHSNCSLVSNSNFFNLWNLRISHILGDSILIEPFSLAMTYVALVALIGKELLKNDDDDHRNGD